jgi:hypothetical protein
MSDLVPSCLGLETGYNSLEIGNIEFARRPARRDNE